MIAALFQHPMTLSTSLAFWLLLPLCVTVAVVYKALRAPHVSQVPRQSAVLMGLLLAGLATLAAALWAVARWWPG